MIVTFRLRHNGHTRTRLPWKWNSLHSSSWYDTNESDFMGWWKEFIGKDRWAYAMTDIHEALIFIPCVICLFCLQVGRPSKRFFYLFCCCRRGVVLIVSDFKSRGYCSKTVKTPLVIVREGIQNFTWRSTASIETQVRKQGDDDRWQTHSELACVLFKNR